LKGDFLYSADTSLASAAVTIVNFATMKVLNVAVPSCAGCFAACRHGTVIAVVGVEVVIDMAVEVSGAMKPWAGTDEGSTGEPLGAIVAVGSATVGSSFVVAVGAVRSDPDVDAYLGLCWGGRCSEERKTSYSS
jgi:hypothetical protein